MGGFRGHTVHQEFGIIRDVGVHKSKDGISKVLAMKIEVFSGFEHVSVELKEGTNIHKEVIFSGTESLINKSCILLVEQKDDAIKKTFIELKGA